jgi:hypothetical protein
VLTRESRARWSSLKLDLTSKTIAVMGYTEDGLEQATNDYLAIEKLEKTGTVTDSVLVSVDSMANLRKA